MEHYGSATMPMQLRMFVESVYGRGPGGQDGSAMLQLQVMPESGPSMHSSNIDVSGLMR
jgi:splicing suppressor protein 51